MRTENNARKAKIRQGRLEIVAEMYKRGNSIRNIANEVRTRLNITCSTRTVCNDIKRLLAEWREARIEDIDSCIQLELERIDDAVRELWEQWEASKREQSIEKKHREGINKGKNKSGNLDIETKKVTEIKESRTSLGDPAYISEIRQQLMERRKLLGLYAPEKKDISGSVSFASMLIESGMVDDAEEKIRQSQETK